MTQPPPPPPPPSGQPGQPGQPPWGQQAWGQPSPGQWAGPRHAQEQWDYLGQEQTGWDPAAGARGLPPQPPRRRRAPLIAAVVAVVVLVAGGVTAYVAVSDQGNSTSGGASSPQAAVTSIVSDLNKSDMLGVLDHLAPGERQALLDPIKDGLATGKRLHVLKPGTNLSKVSGTQFDAKNLMFAKQTDTINDHVQVVELTGGTISINSDLSKVPFTDQFLKVAFPHGIPPQSAKNVSIDIGQFISNKNHGEPIRIATEKVDGKWYPSILYTIADYAARNAGIDKPGSPVPAVGAPSPEDAVRELIDAATRQDYRRMIELTSPSEMAALHDYGSVALRDAPAPRQPALTIKDLDLTSKGVSGGVRVSFKSITVEVDGQQVTVAVDGSCLRMSAQGESQKFCAAAAVNEISQAVHGSLTADQKSAFEHLFAGLPNIGIDTSQSGGKWYVDPMRSYFDLSNSLLSGLQGNDLLTLLAMIPHP